MRFFVLFILIVFIPFVAKAQTLPYLDGLPVIDGFTIMEDSLIIFDKPEGQLTEISMICTRHCPSETAILAYYADILSKLRWQPRNNHVFTLNNNRSLRLDYAATQEPSPSVIVTFHSRR